MKSDMLDESDNELLSNGFKINNKFDYGAEIATLLVKNKKQALYYGKDIGEYIILNCANVHILGKTCEKYITKLIEKNIKKFISKANNVLVVGLGNDKLTADALGAKCVQKNLVTGNLKEVKNNLKNVMTIIPDVFANTGIKTNVILESICEKVKPDLVVIIDSLGTINENRLACSFQITTSGIVPGGALYAGNKKISSSSLKTKCLVIGVPLMLVRGKFENVLAEILCPKNIDEYVNRCAEIIASALNNVFHKNFKNWHNIL